MNSFAEWIGREQLQRDIVTLAPLDRLAATLDHVDPPWKPGEVPPLGHWLFHLPDARQSLLDPDGHPRRGEFMPPVPQPRRMWAGSRIKFLSPIRIGDAIVRRSIVQAITAKAVMTFVTLRHEVSVEGRLSIVEEQDLVYLPARTGLEERLAKSVDLPAEELCHSLIPDQALLLRYSALTFNAHRIHYDRDYACGIEHYPGLVVHGPLLATFLMDLALRNAPAARVNTFNFRARSPVFVGHRLSLSKGGSALWVRDSDGTVAMTAEIEILD